MHAFYNATSLSIAGAQKELIITANSDDTVTKTLHHSVTNYFASEVEQTSE
jgi:hypothetical protein